MSSDGLRVLLADDEETLRAVISEVLEEDGYEVTACASGEEALATYQANPFPLVVTDIVMGGMTGIQLLEAIKAVDSSTQVVIMTSHATVESAMKALRAGAYDFLIKPFEDLDMINTVLGRAAEKVRLTLENQQLVASLQKQATELEQANFALKKLADSLRSVADRDGLTGLYNHRWFRDSLIRELNTAQKSETPLSLLFMDVDYFKTYNDTNGHLMGDDLLRDLAQLFLDKLGDKTLVARYGGEEMVAVLPGVARDQALEVAEGLRATVQAHPFPGRETQPAKALTLSIGVASYPEDGTDASVLIDHADQAVYEAKGTGRNKVCVYRASEESASA